MRTEGFDQKVLEHFGKLLFPTIAQGIINGYNVYKNSRKTDAPYVINYLHSDLGVDARGRQHPHREELMDKLRQFGPAQITEKIVDRIVQRMATYKRGDWEDDPPGVRYFTLDRQELMKENLANFAGLVIVEGMQYDLGVELRTAQEVSRVIDVFNKYTYARKIKRDGTVSSKQNPHAIINAWIVPLITISHHKKRRFSGFQPVAKVSTYKREHEASTLLVRPTALEEYLRAKNEQPHTSMHYANKAFIDYL